MAHTAADARVAGPLRRGPALLVIAVAIAAAALIPRLVSLERGFMIDERLWLERSVHFVDAVSDARFGDAYTTGHPGVTTSWVAGLAQKTLPPDASLRERYARARAALVVANVLLLLVVWWIARPLLGELGAVLGSAVLAFDPLIFALTRVVHLDGLQTLAMTASFLALLRAIGEPEDRGMLVASGALAGIALMSRTFAAFALLAAVVLLWRDGRGIRRRLLWWSAAAVAVCILVWPLLWVRPWKAVSLLVTGATSGALEDSDAGRFFFGAHIAAPGPLFYPVALALRTTVLTLPAVVAAWVWARRRRGTRPAPVVIQLLTYGLAFVTILSLSFKTADRYLLPAIAAFDLAVAAAAARWLQDRRGGRWNRATVAVALAVTLLVHGAPGLAIHPYELAHFNWLVGGPIAAQRTVPIGRGEGLDEAARDLNRLPDAETLTVATTRLTGFEEFFDGRTIRIEDSSLAAEDGPVPDLVLFYFSSVQAGRVSDVWQRYRDRDPMYRLDINRIPYVRVYRVSSQR